MKNSILTITVFVITLISSLQITAQEFKNLDKSPMDMASYPSSYKISEKLVKIIYSRPQLNGRDLVKLAPPGKVWRTGANEATEITFYNDVIFGGKALKAGTYSLFTIPSYKGDWTVIINKARNVWGSYYYNQDLDIIRVPWLPKLFHQGGVKPLNNLALSRRSRFIYKWKGSTF